MKLLPRNEVLNLIETDEAFLLSVNTLNTQNMRLVLRAHGYEFSEEAAEYAIFFGEQELANLA